jgi:hypothetical protein
VRANGMVVGEPQRDRVAALFIRGEDIAGVQTFPLDRAVEALDASGLADTVSVPGGMTGQLRVRPRLAPHQLTNMVGATAITTHAYTRAICRQK